MHFTLKEWNLIQQAVNLWLERSEKIKDEVDQDSDLYRIYRNQVWELKDLKDKIMNSEI